jgi:hypothetical protein
MTTQHIFAFIAALIIAQTGTVGQPPAPQIYSVHLPVMARAPASWQVLMTAQGKPFTDAVQVGNSLYISRQDGVIYRDGVAWVTVPVNSAGEAGLNALSTNGRSLFAAYVSAANRITVAQIVTGDKRIVPIADFGDAGTKHNAAGLHYINGVLLFGIGDNTDALSAQDDTKAGGKVWAIDLITGGKTIAARGLRNPWHITTINAQTLISDVGETKYEEVNVLTHGANFGWPCFEALEPRIYAPAVCDGLQWVTPAFFYGRDMGRGIVGVAQIDGHMVYADFSGVLRIFDSSNPQIDGQVIWRVDGFVSKLTPMRDGVALLSFAGGVARAEVWR